MPTTIALVRHGETDWNRERRFQGHSDPPLNELGRRQARDLAESFEDEVFDAVYTSPLARAHETAEIVARRLGLEVRLSEALREVDVGSWEGLRVAEVETRFPDGYRRWLEHRDGWQGGESYDELGARVVSGLLELAERHEGGRLLAVTHGGPILSAVAVATRTPFAEIHRTAGPVRNCAIFRFVAQDGNLDAVD